MMFMNTEKLVPKLRFSGFSENWESIKIGDCLDVKYGKDYKHLNEGKYPVLGTGGVMEYVDDFLYSGESILIGRKGTIDKPAYIDGSFWTVDTLFYTEIKNQFPKFLFYCISNINWLKYNEASGVPSLSANNIKNVKINIPSLIEQKKIANFITSIDYKIELLEKKHKSLVDFKKYLMQQIFSQKLRFNEFDEEWREYRLKNISTMKYGKMPDKTKITEDSSKFPIYSGFRILGYYEECNIKKNDLLVTARGSGTGYAKLSPADAYLTNLSIAVDVDKNIASNEFLYYYFEKHSLKYLYSGSAQPQITINDLRTVKIKIPSIKEQIKIAKVLSNADNKINVIENEIKCVKEFRHGLLQKMFI